LDVHSDVLKISSGEEYREKIINEEREKVCKTIMDKIVVEKVINEVKVVVPGQADGEMPYEEDRIEVTYKAVIDTKIPPMSEVIKHMKEEK
jgi:hypothetical protein